MRPNAEHSHPLEIEVMTDGSGKLTGAVARELTNLLIVIRRCAAFLRQSMSDADPRQKGVSDILEATERAAVLAARLHAHSRSRVSRMELPAELPTGAAPSRDAGREPRSARRTQELKPSAMASIDRRAD